MWREFRPPSGDPAIAEAQEEREEAEVENLKEAEEQLQKCKKGKQARVQQAEKEAEELAAPQKRKQKRKKGEAEQAEKWEELAPIEVKKESRKEAEELEEPTKRRNKSKKELRELEPIEVKKESKKEELDEKKLLEENFGLRQKRDEQALISQVLPLEGEAGEEEESEEDKPTSRQMKELIAPLPPTKSFQGTWWRPVELLGMQFFCFECKLPSQTWWAVLPDRSILRPAFYRAHPTATRHDVRLRLQHLQEAGCPVPWVLAKELEDQKLPHYSKRDQKLRAVKLQKLIEELEVDRVCLDDLDASSSSRMWPEMESFCGQRPEAEKNFYCRSYSDSGWPRFLPLQQHPFLRRLGAEVLWERERKGGIETGWFQTRGASCYPCLVAGRHCRGRKLHPRLGLAMACTSCRLAGLSVRQCAVALCLEGTPSATLTDHWARVQPDLSTCHVCRCPPERPRRTPQGAVPCTVCVGCHAWLCHKTSCHADAQVRQDLPYWLCCHCLGVPLACFCLQTHADAAQLLNNVHMLMPKASKALITQYPQPKTAAQLHRTRALRRWWGRTRLLSPRPSRASWLDYAGLLRKMTIVEFERFKAAVQRLRAEIMGLDRRRQRITCMKWLMKVQSFAEPSLIFTFLLRLQNEHDKERRLMEWEPIYRATRRRWVLSPLDAELGFWQMRHRRFVAELGENDFPPSQSCFVQLRERIPTQLKWWRVHRQLQHQALRGAHGSAATPHKLRRLRRLKRRRPLLRGPAPKNHSRQVGFEEKGTIQRFQLESESEEVDSPIDSSW
ncbi:unnamed protein product [Durusdinium trenchii]|uniref:Uncharacterized protein n=1 Tax=Durusdinium trenchii TaxID=1381693 RepID=A0ABP0KN80_9DINO